MSRRSLVRRAFLITLLVVVAASTVPRAGAVAPSDQPQRTQETPPLTILSAAVDEVPPLDWRTIPKREVLVSLTLSTSPACDANSGPLEVGLLVDRDRQAASGVPLQHYPQLGMDARIAITCEPATGRLRSAIGSVSIEPLTGGHVRALLRTTVARLPSLEFLWVPYVRHGPMFVAGPFKPAYARWAITERLHP